jgi:hypothetical protein
MTDEKIILLLKKNNITIKVKTNEIKIDDFINKIINSVYVDKYINDNIKIYKVYHGIKYMSFRLCKFLLLTCKTQNAKYLISQLHQPLG